MRGRGRPKGTGYDDAAVINAVICKMWIDGASRRAAIIDLCGHDQLRRIEMKMAGISSMWNERRRRAVTTKKDGCSTEKSDRHSDLANGRSLLVLGPFPGGEGYFVISTDWLRNVGTPQRSNTLNPFAGTGPSPAENVDSLR